MESGVGEESRGVKNDSGTAQNRMPQAGIPDGAAPVLHELSGTGTGNLENKE